jgi:hypothetical protein
MRSVLSLIVALTLASSAAAAPGKAVPRLIFPVVGTTSYSDDFGAPRAGGPHQGIDILAARHAPAVAVEAGKVEFWTTSANAGCMLYLHGASGTTYLYIHLNNDLTAHNDNRGSCVAGTAYAEGLKDGARVAAGQLVGYVGDSGDANGIHPHLHFEVHPNDGVAVDGYPYLRKAQPLIFYAKAGTKVALSITGTISSSDGYDLGLKTSSVQSNATTPVAVSRPILLSLAQNAQVSFDLPGVTVGLEALLAGMRATVYTLPVRATLAAQRGDANTLTATRILLTH